MGGRFSDEIECAGTCLKSGAAAITPKVPIAIMNAKSKPLTSRYCSYPSLTGEGWSEGDSNSLG